ncbi:MAG: hypothetical protein IJY97_06435 [Clostridia bacterium]|nr:hypothetical protein [Clostridia bacterium]
MKLKKWLFPVISAVITSIIILLSYVAAEPYSHDSGYGGLVIGLIGLIFCFAIAIPVLSVLYSKICLRNSENKFLFTLYNSFLLALSTLLFSIGSSPMIIPVISSISFVWCEIWGLLGLIRKKEQKSN